MDNKEKAVRKAQQLANAIYTGKELNVEISYDICASKADTSKAQMIENEYRHNSKFRAYVDKYCIANGVTVEQALKHELVRQVFLMHTEV